MRPGALTTQIPALGFTATTCALPDFRPLFSERSEPLGRPGTQHSPQAAQLLGTLDMTLAPIWALTSAALTSGSGRVFLSTHHPVKHRADTKRCFGVLLLGRS